MAVKINLVDPRYDENAREMHRARRRMLRRLVQIRNERDHRQADVARTVGVGRSTISRFENELENSNPTLDTVLRYAHAVGASIHMDAKTIEERDNERENATTTFRVEIVVASDLPKQSMWSDVKVTA